MFQSSPRKIIPLNIAIKDQIQIGVQMRQRITRQINFRIDAFSRMPEIDSMFSLSLCVWMTQRINIWICWYKDLKKKT